MTKSEKKLSPPSEFDKAIRGIAGTPKAEVDRAEQREKAKKKSPPKK